MAGLSMSNQAKMHVPFLDLNAQLRTIRGEVDTAIAGVLDAGNFVFGPEVGEFERAFAQYVGVKHCVGVGNGLDALSLILQAWGVGPGDEVIVQANTYIASVFAISAVGATPVMVDCEPNAYQIDVSKIEAAITSRTKVIMPVHLTGHPADMDPILRIAASHRLRVLEDAAQAHGALYKGRKCGSMGDAAGFSFYPSKNLGAIGDAGGVVTNDAALAERVAMLRHNGQRAKNVHEVVGSNSRLDTLQAAVLLIKLRHLDAWNAARARHAALYRTLLAGVGDLRFQTPQPASKAIYHVFIVESERRDALQKHLHGNGIGTLIHYPTPPHLQQAYRHLNFHAWRFRVAEHLAPRILSLPMYAELRDEQIRHVVDCVRGFFESGG